MATEITVRGSFSMFQRPERGTVHATITYEDSQMEPVYQRLVGDLDTVKASIMTLHDPDQGPVTWWSAEQLRTWSTRPWNKDGKQKPLVHHAAVAVEVKFRDFAALSRWVGHRTVSIEGFRVTRVEWALTVKRKDELLHEVRTRAVQDAVTRAQQYADALGLGTVSPDSIADAGMLIAGLSPAGEASAGSMRPRSGAVDAEQLELIPNDIEVKAVVDARFAAERTPA
ncbi:SIMPL domain-containing protein [Mycobacterium sp. NPDC050853]|uniref:SIMPL domain-containing protein n=1 Tax=Mycobacterium sp. NPDC050853 TaxID=3155160 RepID=UPI0033CD52E7